MGKKKSQFDPAMLEVVVATLHYLSPIMVKGKGKAVIWIELADHSFKIYEFQKIRGSGWGCSRAYSSYDDIPQDVRNAIEASNGSTQFSPSSTLRPRNGALYYPDERRNKQ